MPTSFAAARDLPLAARRAADSAGGSDTLDRLGRVGYAAHGVVYILIGALAVLAAAHRGGGVGGAREALSVLGDGPLGPVLLGGLGVGLACYALWRFAQAVLDVDGDARRKDNKKSAAMRAARFVSGVAHVALAAAAFRLALGARDAGGGDEAPGLTARALELPFGVFLVGAAGVVFFVMAALQAKKAWTRSFERELDLSALDAHKRDVVVNTARVGLVARAVVFAVIGAFIIVAAWQHDPGQARGLGGALQALAARSWGTVLLGATAAGLVAYGVSEWVRAIYRVGPAHR